MEFPSQQTIFSNWSFVAMEYYFGILNRTYKIFVTPTILAGAFVNHVLSDPGRLPNYWFLPEIYVNYNMVKKYDKLLPESIDFKKQSPLSNFQYSRTQIFRFWYDPTTKWGMGSIAHSGKLYLELENGRRREFILLGLQQGMEIVQHFHWANKHDININNNSKLHNLITQAVEHADNYELWFKLADLFKDQGEKAQEHYCRIYAKRLRKFTPN